MIKLYNIYEGLILENMSKHRHVLNEGVTDEVIDDVIDRKVLVNLTYQESPDSPLTDRYVQVYNRSTTKAGNPAIRVYQGGKETKTGYGWKILRLDRIKSFVPTNMKFHNPISDQDASIPPYNQLGDKSMSSVEKMVDFNKFNRVRSDIKQVHPNYNPITQKPTVKSTIKSTIKPTVKPIDNKEEPKMDIDTTFDTKNSLRKAMDNRNKQPEVKLDEI
jgi:hypothetical protein